MNRAGHRLSESAIFLFSSQKMLIGKFGIDGQISYKMWPKNPTVFGVVGYRSTFDVSLREKQHD